MNLKHRTTQLVAGLALAGALTVGTAGLAVAADGSTATGSDPTAQAARHPRRAVRALGTVVAGTIGIERAALRDALKSGQSIGEVATANGVDPQAVVDAVLAKVDARVDQAVANGRISAERGETIKGKAAERAPQLLDRHFGQQQAS